MLSNLTHLSHAGHSCAPGLTHSQDNAPPPSCLSARIIHRLMSLAFYVPPFFHGAVPNPFLFLTGDISCLPFFFPCSLLSQPRDAIAV